jgi:hypothetical protein
MIEDVILVEFFFGGHGGMLDVKCEIGDIGIIGTNAANSYIYLLTSHI